MSDAYPVIRVPPLGDFKDVEIIEVLVQPGDRVAAEAGIITLESDKASMEVPMPQAGVVRELLVKVGDKVSEGSPILTIATENTTTQTEAAENTTTQTERTKTPATNTGRRHRLVVLGAGPGGYSAAFRAADLGIDTLLIERYPELGGVCLNVGCIPSKALLHIARLQNEIKHLRDQGIDLGNASPQTAAMRRWAQDIVGRMNKGLKGLARRRGVQVLQGEARFQSPHQLLVRTAEGELPVDFDYAIIAAGSRPLALPNMPDDDARVMDSTDALRLESIPSTLLIVGGGIIGLEMATVYLAQGARVTIAELGDELLPGVDRDLAGPLIKRLEQRGSKILTGTRVSELRTTPATDPLRVRFEGCNCPEEEAFDAMLVAIGRRPNSDSIEATKANVQLDPHHCVNTDERQRTNVGHIYAIGDITGEPMLAHKATHQGKVAAEAIAGQKSAFEARCIPSVAYTDPEVAWVGITESEARAQDLTVSVSRFPWAASGRAQILDGSDGLSKLIFDKDKGHLLGMGAVGPQAGDLVAEAALAIEMGCDAEDIALSIHPHPTLSETVGMAAEVETGSITDIYQPTSRRKRTAKKNS